MVDIQQTWTEASASSTQNVLSYCVLLWRVPRTPASFITQDRLGKVGETNMRFATSLVVWFLAILLCAISATNSSAQRRAVDRVLVSDDTYRKVLDLVFPRDDVEALGVEYAFIIRFEPSFAAESQVTIVSRDGIVEVTDYSPQDGRVESKVQEIFHRTGEQNPSLIAKQIRVLRRVVSISPATLDRWRDGFYNSICTAVRDERKFFDSPSKTVMVTMDGTEYLLWYKGIGRLHYQLAGSGIDRPRRADEDILIDWMKSVRRQVTSLLSTPPGNP